MSKKKSTKVEKGNINPNSTARFGKNQIEMIRSVIAFCLASGNVAITNSVAAFATSIAAVKSNLAAIDALAEIIASRITGYAAQKKAMRTALEQISNSLMQSVYSYAVQANDQVLASAMSTTPSQLKNMSAANLSPFIQTAINTVTPIVSSLGDYGITATTISKWQDALDNFSSTTTNPNTAIANRKAAIEQMQTILRQTMVMLYNQSDALAQQFRSSQPQYFLNYRAVRKLKPVGHISTQLRATITDELNQPIANAEVQISGTDLSAFTDEKGYTSISDIPFGSHSVTVINGKTSTEFGPFDFKKGQSLTQRFTVAPAWAEQPKTVVEKQKETVN